MGATAQIVPLHKEIAVATLLIIKIKPSFLIHKDASMNLPVNLIWLSPEAKALVSKFP
jgi:hypothetical protein